MPAGDEEAQDSPERQKKRRRKAKIRDPHRHYRFLDQVRYSADCRGKGHLTEPGQAYLHGMMDGEAVRQNFYDGKPDHLFEIRRLQHLTVCEVS
jgi:hypothetical protein